MSLLKRLAQKLWSVALIWGWWLILEGSVWAKAVKPPATEEKSSNTGVWVLPYTLVILSIGLGMLVVCRTSRRSDRARPQKYEALKTAE